MQKQTQKYILSMLIAAMLMLSMLPATMVSAVKTIELRTPDDSAALTTGPVGTKVLVKGADFSPGIKVSIYWDAVDPASKLNETTVKGDKTFKVLVNIPEAIFGPDHWVIAEDASAAFSIEAQIELDPEIGLKDDVIHVTGTGFAEEEDVTLTWDANPLTTTPSTVTTDTVGSFACTFKVPTATYGVYTVVATDESAHTDSATFTVGATITLTPAEGPTGKVVAISGRGFTKTAGLAVTVTIDGTDCPQVADIETKSDGTFSGQIVIPTIAVGEYEITAEDTIPVSSKADFEVTGTTEITLTPKSGAPDDAITIMGDNFTAVANKDVTIDFGPITGYATLKTNSTGGFKSSLTVPPLTPSTTPYDVVATDANGLTATAGFRVALTTLAISPSKGATGTKVLVIGGGYTPDAVGKDFNVTIDGELMVDGEGTLETDGSIPSGTYVYVPTVPVGSYEVTVMDEDGVIGQADFTVTETTEMILTPPTGPVDYKINMTLNYLTARAGGQDLSIVLYNETTEGEVDYTLTMDAAIITAYAPFVAVRTNDTGSFEGYFLVPDLAIGDYKINATDPDDLGVWEKSFKVVEVTIEVTTSRAIYYQGQDVTFKLKCTFQSTGDIEVTDPDGFIHTLDVEAADYQAIGDWYYAYISMTLSTDAPLGDWSWTATVEEKEKTGTFEVATAPTLETIGETVAALEDSLDTLSDAVDDLSSALGGTSSDVTALSTAISNLRTTVDTIKADAAAASSAASSAQSAAEAAKTAAETANNTASGISMATYGAMALSLIAALAAIAAVLTLQRKVAG